MKLAILSDIHGNLTALEAVLNDVANESVDKVICLGDIAYKGPEPGECVSEIRRLGIPCVYGNTDLYLLGAADVKNLQSHEPSYFPSQDELPYLNWHLERMSNLDIEYLSKLPFEYRFEIDNQSFLFVHGTPKDCYSAIQPHDSIQYVESSIANIRADWLIMGHIHKQFIFRSANTVLVNTGAVGFSLDGDSRAAYVTIDTSRDKVTLHRVNYDIEKAVQCAKKRNFCFSPEWYGEALRKGWWEPIPYSERKKIEFPN
jgi:putative phosphoesterase